MKTPRLLSLSLLTCALLCHGPALAAEGMFLLDKLPEARLKKSGLQISIQQLQKLSRAVIQVGRGGTGSFVSNRGLLVTNHHVAYGCLARLNARKEHQGIMDRGYLARTPADELPCPGYDLRIVKDIQDVTAKVLQGIPAPTRENYTKRHEQLRLRREELRQACEKSKQYTCTVSAMDGGASYYLSTYGRVRDVRLVYAPPKALGKYGGDIDNWMYPRHTADFAFLRAYVGARDAGTPFHQHNLPMKTPVHLQVSRDGVKQGSLVMVVGFPGRTSRHATSHAVRFHANHKMQTTIELLEGALAVLNKRRQASKDAFRKYMGLESSLQNGLKYYRMSRKGFERYKVFGNKLQSQLSLLTSLPPAQAKKARGLLKEISGVYGRYLRIHRKFSALARLKRIVPTMRVAHDISKWAKEKAKPDKERKDARYKDKNVYRFVEAAARLEKETEPHTERALLYFFLADTEKLPRGQRLRCVATLKKATLKELKRARQAARQQKQDLAAYFQKTYGVKLSKDLLQSAVDMLYARSKILAHSSDPAEVARAVKLRGELFQRSARDLARLDDPLLRFAGQMAKEFTAMREGPFKLVEQYLAGVLHPRWVKAYKRSPFPDANFTLRLTFGSVQDYTSSETKETHRFLTDLSELLKKDRGKFPFLVPESLKKAAPNAPKSPFADRFIQDIPVNFTSTLDTTGGNSGSPVMDSKGRLVGLLFDGTPESILSDWQYLEKEQRSISVDIRLALYLASLRKAQSLLQEMGIAPK